ncbi:hypothetical protein BDZ97DRAFT_1924534 [Flammula alnicola]|nr:hypothetical protein BDZ97DRAFT_1924534 [Flammula alnicola]
MSTLTVKRARALSSACRGAQGGRLVHSSSVNQAPALSSASLAGDQPEEITLQPIFDIFDAPSRLSESSDFIRGTYTSPPKRTVVSDGPPPSRPVPTSLPKPIIFDGPARPQNGVLAFQRRLRDAGLRAPSPTTRSQHTPPSRPFSSSEPSVQLFDGPARITRYHHQSSGSSGSFETEQNSTKYIFALGLAGAVGCATVAKNDEKSQL